MIGLRVSVPIACFRKGLAREYLESESIPPPSTCYGFLLSFVGEADRKRHIGCRICPVLLNTPDESVVLRTIWRVKKTPLGSPGNTRPDFQQLLAPVELVVWIDSKEEAFESTLEHRVARGIEEPSCIDRFGGLSLGESTHLVDSVSRFNSMPDHTGRAFLLNERGRITLPVWVDHVGSAGTRYATGSIESTTLVPPEDHRMPKIQPLGGPA